MEQLQLSHNEEKTIYDEDNLENFNWVSCYYLICPDKTNKN